MSSNGTYKVAAMYHFTTIENCESFKSFLMKLCTEFDILGALIIAPEGLNGTVASKHDLLDSFIRTIKSDKNFKEMDVKYSETIDPPFYRMRLKITTEVIKMGIPEINPALQRGIYVEPKDWNTLIQSPDVIVIDTRNDYEVELGTFEGNLYTLMNTIHT